MIVVVLHIYIDTLLLSFPKVIPRDYAQAAPEYSSSAHLITAYVDQESLPFAFVKL